MRILGTWSASGSAAHSSAELDVDGEHYTLRVDGAVEQYGNVAEVTVGDRLGNTIRTLSFSNGDVFETDDNDAIDRFFSNSSRVQRVIHIIESNMAMVLISLVLTIVVAFSFIRWGVPWVSTYVAHALPNSANDLVGNHAFEFLDEYVFEPSELDDARKRAISDRFSTNLGPFASDQDLQLELHFRKWQVANRNIPNALALPSGDIILTDRFVELSQNSDEVDSVLLHEIGHVVHRHSLQTLVKSTFLATLVFMIVGDNSALVDMGVGLGTLVVNSSYSRSHESEADTYAFEKMLLTNIAPQKFSDILTRITNDLSREETISKKGGVNSSTREQTKFSDYLSSHPKTVERAKLAQHYQRCFEKGLKRCPKLAEAQ